MVSRETLMLAGLRELSLDEVHARSLAIFADLVVDRAVPLGLLGPKEVDHLVDRHILQSCAIASLVADAESIVDVGPGAGFPGVPLCIVTGIRVGLIESSARAAGFLRGAVAKLGLPAQVVHETAEEAGHHGHREHYGIAVTRAVAPPDVALELTLPLVRVGGRAALLVGPSGHETEGAARAAARALGGGRPRYFPVQVPGAGGRTWVMIVDKVDPTAEKYPRRPGVPRRRPLGGGVTGVN